MKTANLNIKREWLLPTPQSIKEKLPQSAKAEETVLSNRRIVQDIIDGRDQRIFVVVGPCSIHDPKAALEYATRLKKLKDRLEEKIVLLMRVYFEKPRTVMGWKGYINDPDLDDSFKIDEGLYKGRELLLKINEIGLGTATEALDPITPQYLDDLVAWYAIGARTAESQTHREMASGLSTPVGFKNGTDGNIQTAINALLSSREGHHFLGINQSGQCTVLQTAGNKYGHIVLRGGTLPNYDRESIANCIRALKAHNLPEKIMVDCSHANSLKNHELQGKVFNDCLDQIKEGNKSIVSLMLESHLFAGNQKLENNVASLRYGVSITDACIDWETTETLLTNAAKEL